MTPHTEAELRGDLERLNRTVAEVLGWTMQTHYWPTEPLKRVAWVHPVVTHGVGFRKYLPDFTGSLDACSTFEAGLTETEKFSFALILEGIVQDRMIYPYELTATDHCIAFLRLRNVITPTTPQ